MEKKRERKYSIRNDIFGVAAAVVADVDRNSSCHQQSFLRVQTGKNHRERDRRRRKILKRERERERVEAVVKD
jgi:hypothetical protein